MDWLIRFIKKLLLYCLISIGISFITISVCFITGNDYKSILKIVAIVLVIISALGILGTFIGSKDMAYIQNGGMYKSNVDGVIEDGSRTKSAIYRGITLLFMALIIYSISLINI